MPARIKSTIAWPAAAKSASLAGALEQSRRDIRKKLRESDATFRVVPLALNDVVFVPSWGWHQFRNVGDEPFGFLCAVTAERDRPVRPTPEQIAAFEQVPAIAAFIRY